MAPQALGCEPDPSSVRGQAGVKNGLEETPTLRGWNRTASIGIGRCVTPTPSF